MVNGGDVSDLGSLVLSVSRALSACNTLDDLSEIFCTHIRPLGLTCAASGIVTGPRASSPNPFHFNNWPPEWRSEYAQEGYLHIDPLARHAVTSGAPATWTDVISTLPRTDPGRKVCAAARRHGFSEGMVIPFRDWDGEIGMVTMGGDRPKLTADEATFLTAMSSTVFFAAEALNRAAQSRSARGAFTPRELDCIALLGEGLTDGEIATALRVSRETVISHMENARRKVGARSRAHLLSIAMRYRKPERSMADAVQGGQWASP
jgi:LuxR family quorum sensing-dependent transcriptional regulator